MIWGYHYFWKHPNRTIGETMWNLEALHPFLYTHCWWHLSLLHCERGNYDDCLAIFDESWLQNHSSVVTFEVREGLHGPTRLNRRDFGQKALKVNKVQTHRQENHRRVRAEEKWPPTMENEEEIRNMCKCVLMLCQVQLNALNLPLSCTWVSCKAFHVCALFLVWGFGDSSWDRTGANQGSRDPYSFCCSNSFGKLASHNWSQLIGFN